ncbi:ARM repeat-containing protein [Ramaria rubella]|nr:ARM repeat-containing protein [Ramaria rubella]
MAPTSLAAQLSKGVSLNASLLVDRSRRRPTESYVFTNREADQHDFHSIHALGVNGLSRLKTLDSKFTKYEGNIFSDAARDLDRTLHSQSQNAALDRTLSSFLKDLGPYLLEAPTSKALEWVVRRFRVHEFNVDAIMALFLPYHETVHFAKIVSILHVKESSLWSFLSPLKAAGKPLPRSILVDEMVVNVDLVRFVVGLLPEALRTGRTFRTLTGFTASITMDYLAHKGMIEEEVVALLLPAFTRTLSSDSDQDCALAGCVALAALSQRCRLSSHALGAIVSEMVKQRHTVSQKILPFLVAVVGPQDALHDFSDSTAESILTLPGVVDSLEACLSWVGIEKLLLPLLPYLTKCVKGSSSSDILNSLLLSASLPPSIVERSTQLLLDQALRSEESSSSVPLQLLTVIFQRYGTEFSETTAKRLGFMEDENGRQKLEEIVRSVTLTSSSDPTDHGKWILSSNTFDVNSRVTAVRELIKILNVGVMESESLEDVHNALRARVVDTSTAVIGVLYSDPKTILPVLANESFIEAVSSVLAAPDASRIVMRLHFAFIAEYFHNHCPDLVPALFERVYLPFLLFTKPRQKTVAIVWRSLKDSKLAEYELLAGCTDVVFPDLVPESTSRSIEEMVALNSAVTNRIAGNIVASNVYPRHLDMLLHLLSASDTQTTNICYLILRSLLNQLSGEHQVDAALRILISMELNSLDALHHIVANVTSIQDAISDDALLTNVVTKPNSPGTTHRLQVAILVLLPIVKQPIDAKIDWLGDGSLTSSDMRGKRFVELARAIYVLGNSSSATHSLSTTLLKALFVNLREQALLFLAGVWTASLLTDPDSINLAHAALFHAAAFLRAQTTDADYPQDFQVMLPSLFIALRSKHRIVRLAAMDCVGVISQTSSSARAISTVYGLDSVYGSNSNGLQYLEWLDFRRYVTSLAAHREHFINDGDYLDVFTRETICKSRSDMKRETGYKQRVLCYILSHATTWISVRARVSLLETLRYVPHRVKLQMFLPLIQSVASGDHKPLPWHEKDKALGAIYFELLLKAYDRTVIPELIETGSGSWSTFVRLIRFTFTDDAAPLSARRTILQRLCGGLFDSLTIDLQLEICIILVEFAAASSDSHLILKEAMGSLLKRVKLIISLLDHFQPTAKDNSQRAPKRAKLTSLSEGDSEEPTLRPLTVLVEILAAHPMPGSVEVMSSALDVLARVCHIYSQTDTNYVMQLLMSIIESIATSIVNANTLPSSSLRMEILVELLRVSDNPQTFNQTLLLIATLARLAPEFVMQNVMPVFTFMGSNVFHRDDSYSFRVVHRTVDSVVPVVVNSLRAKHLGSLELQIASREFLRVFTDASTHVPRHRRTQFFNHLVEVLGTDEFTGSVCLLLVDKAANRVVRKKPGEIANALTLPLAILRANSKATPFRVIEQLLQETTRLLRRVLNPNSKEDEAFLELPLDTEQPLVVSTKRQMHAIIIFVDLVLQQSSRKTAASNATTAEESVRLLLGLANLAQEHTSIPEFSDVSKVAMRALSHLLRVISAAEFASTISTTLTSNNSIVESGALNLLASRLGNIAPKTRQDISPTIIGIVEFTYQKLKNQLDTPTLRATLNALRAIAQTADVQEIPSLTKTLPLVLEVADNHQSLTAESVGCIHSLSTKIGPRILPHFHQVVQFCSGVLRDPQEGSFGVFGDRMEQDAQAVLVTLLSTISQFWGIDDLVQLSELSLSTQPALLNIRKTLAKKIPAKQALPALFRLWSEMAATKHNQPSLNTREAFFDLFKRVVRFAPRDDVHGHLQDIFKLFVEAFDMYSGVNRQEVEPFEKLTMATFVDVVTKLNEASFKPIFRRLFDWALNDAAVEKLVHRQITFFCLLTSLINLLKGLLTPYMGMVLVPLTELLDSYRSNRNQSERLWMSAVELFRTSLTLDEGAFWRADKLHKLIPTFIAQIDVCPFFATNEARQPLKLCLGALVAAMDDDSSLKSLNLGILMQTRSDEAQVRLFALECAEHLWQLHSDQLSGFVSDVVTFIAECADDEHDEVAKAARRLKKTIEKKCGSLDVLMQ